MFSDLHKNSIEEHPEFARMMAPISYLQECLNLDFVVNLGDIVNNPCDEVYDEVFNSLNDLNVPFINIAGNHDWITLEKKINQLTNIETAIFDNVGAWFYFDDENESVRYIILDSQDSGNKANDNKVIKKSSKYTDRSWQQLDWFANVALKTNKKVIIFQHQALGSTQ